MAQFAALLRRDNQSVRYLVVDDSVFARKNLMKMIEMFGGEIAGEAGDGLTAIAEFNRTKPDVVLMDITMPQMEGIEAVERIVKTIAVFDDFCHANDPHEEHDFGSFEAEGHTIFFKIDYFDRNLKYHSPDPSDPALTVRVITIMLAQEY